jgi:fumarylacetoacetate (FAA) hydrolase
MILATRQNGKRDGELILVAKDRQSAISARCVAPTLQAALDAWSENETKLQALAILLESGCSLDVFKIEKHTLLAPLPRAYAWLDGSAFLNHVLLVRKARGVEPPKTLQTDPLMYQGGSDAFLAPTDAIELAEASWGIDFESEVVVITDDVPMGVEVSDAPFYIKLITICNDVSLRNLIPTELEKGFGFLQSKPSTAFAPFVLTPDELGSSWLESRVHLPLESWHNGKLFGNPDAGVEMHFSFAELISHAAKTRPLRAGTLIGSGTVSNSDRGRGSSCIAERRMIEKIDGTVSQTPFLNFGDQVRIEMFKEGLSLFGAIDQKVVKYKR